MLESGWYRCQAAGRAAAARRPARRMEKLGGLVENFFDTAAAGVQP